MHELKNIDDVWDSQTIVCNRIVVIFIQPPVRDVK